MKVGIIFTGSGPILIFTTYDSFTGDNFVEKLKTKGVNKFIAYEVPVERAKEKYRMHFPIIMNDLKQSDDLRVLDYNEHHIMNNFSFKKDGSACFLQVICLFVFKPHLIFHPRRKDLFYGQIIFTS